MAKPWMDFAHIRAQSDFLTILARYDIAPARHYGQVTLLCPFHDDRQPSLSVNLDRKLFYCFACQAKGDILDFVARIEDVSLPFAAEIVIECCGILVEGQRPKPAEDFDEGFSGQRCSREDRHDASVPCCKLTLDPTHRHLFDRGLTPELIDEFGLGYCSQGRLRNRVCIPIHSRDGQHILAYCGRWANNDVPDGTPRYLMPRGFKKSAVLFNYHRVVGARHLVIVEGYWSVFRLHALNVPAVALMGTNLSDAQVSLLRQLGVRQLTLLLDADRAGRKATIDLLPRLSELFFTRTPVLPDDESPDTIPQDLLLWAVRS